MKAVTVLCKYQTWLNDIDLVLKEMGSSFCPKGGEMQREINQFIAAEVFVEYLLPASFFTDTGIRTTTSAFCFVSHSHEVYQTPAFGYIEYI